MEFRRLTERDLKSLLELYKQLQPDDDPGSVEDSRKVWQYHTQKKRVVIKLFFKAVSHGKMHIGFMKIKDLTGTQKRHLICA